MSVPSLIFWVVFIIPLVVFLIWLMRQDKRNGKTGLIVLAIMVIVHQINNSLIHYLNMSVPSLIFWVVFIIPLVVFLIWLMRQDKRNGKTGLIVLAIMVIGGILYMYWKTRGQ